MDLTSVVHVRSGKAYDVYIGRAGRGEDGYYGNPHVKGEKCARCGQMHLTASSTLPCFNEYFLERIGSDAEYRARIRGLKGLTLGCFCLEGNPCHGVVMADWLNRPDEEIERDVEVLTSRYT